MRNILSILTLVALVALFSACSSDDAPASSTVPGSSGNAVALNGAWARACSDRGTDRSGSSVNTISGGSSNFSGERWNSDDNCTGDSDFTTAIATTFTLGDDTTATLSGVEVTAKKRDLTFTTMTITLHNQEIVDTWNSAEVYGFSDWALEAAKSIFGLNSDGTTDTEAGSVDKDIWYIDDSETVNKLYSGDGSAVLDADGYPTALSEDYRTR